MFLEAAVSNHAPDMGLPARRFNRCEPAAAFGRERHRSAERVFDFDRGLAMIMPVNTHRTYGLLFRKRPKTGR